MAHCEFESCTEDATVLTKTQSSTPSAGGMSFSKRCEDHKLSRPEGTYIMVLPLPPEE